MNRSYWPDAEATGQLLTELCEDLAAAFDVTVLSGQPNQNPDEVCFRRIGQQVHNGVRVIRVWNSRLSKARMSGRALNLLSYMGGASLAALGVPRPDVVVVETDPPLLCLIGAFLQRWHGAKLVVYLQDIYPDLAVALGVVPNSAPARRLRKVMFDVYRRADRVVVLSRDMRRLLTISGVPEDHVVCIPNWVDTRQVCPCQRENPFRDRYGLNGQFIVMYSGNLGLCQRLDDVLVAAEELRDRGDILFLLVGDGASKGRLQATARRLGLSNVRFLPYQPENRLGESLGAADVHLVPLDPRVASCLMPSKLYGVLAAGRPVLTIAPEGCELAEVTRQNRVGMVVPPECPAALADAIRTMAGDARRLDEMGRSARSLAEQKYDRRGITRTFGEMLAGVIAGGRKWQ